MPRARLRLLLLLLLTMAFRQTPLIDPPPIKVPDGMTAIQVGKAVKGGLLGRGWAVTAEQTDGVDTRLTGNDYTASIHVAFDTQQVRIS
jgi:hypothetical protein